MADEQIDHLKFIQAEINKSVGARLAPFIQILAGLELGILHVFNMLHHQGVLERKAAIQSLQETIDENQTQAPEVSLKVLKQILSGLSALEERAQSQSAPVVRFELLQGGLADVQPTCQDQTE